MGAGVSVEPSFWVLAPFGVRDDRLDGSRNVGPAGGARCVGF